jgi:cell division GTPase FtsZ
LKEGFAMILTGESLEVGWNKSETFMRKMYKYPSLFNIDYLSTTGCLVLIIGGNYFSRCDAEEDACSVSYEINPPLMSLVYGHPRNHKLESTYIRLIIINRKV